MDIIGASMAAHCGAGHVCGGQHSGRSSGQHWAGWGDLHGGQVRRGVLHIRRGHSAVCQLHQQLRPPGNSIPHLLEVDTSTDMHMLRYIVQAEEASRAFPDRAGQVFCSILQSGDKCMQCQDGRQKTPVRWKQIVLNGCHCNIPCRWHPHCCVQGWARVFQWPALSLRLV